MVVDNAIVVLENIFRHYQQGKSAFKAAHDGAMEVWGAVLASTLTTIAVFVPVLFVKEEAGQLFRDIALAISCAVTLSLLVAITVIPCMAGHLLRDQIKQPRQTALDRIATAFRDRIVGLVYWLCGTTTRKLATVVGLTGSVVLLSLLLFPKAEYLPNGNLNFLFGAMIPPPGYNLDETMSYRNVLDEKIKHLWGEQENTSQLPGEGIDEFFFVAMHGQIFLGASTNHPLKVKEVLPSMQEAIGLMPGAFGFVSQMSLFQKNGDQGRAIDIEITGPDLERLVVIGGKVLSLAMEHLPKAQAQPLPSLDLSNPELRVITDRRRAAELGLNHRDLGYMVSVLTDGAKASDYQHDGYEIDLILKAEHGPSHRTHLMEQLPVATPNRGVVTLGQVATIKLGNGPVQINHLERERNITIRVAPEDTMALQTAIEIIEDKVIAQLTADNDLGELYRVRLSGSADKLATTANALKWNILLALAITYLLLASLFESFLHPFVILFSVPLAAFGGILGLSCINLFSFQAMDVLTMLGFVILIGTVVNNAILIVHQGLHNIRRYGMEVREAVREATSSRIRPIFMSVGTSVCGMLPLVLFPGAGSELYRGLGSVVVGGLVMSTLFTLCIKAEGSGQKKSPES